MIVKIKKEQAGFAALLPQRAKFYVVQLVHFSIKKMPAENVAICSYIQAKDSVSAMFIKTFTYTKIVGQNPACNLRKRELGKITTMELQIKLLKWKTFSLSTQNARVADRCCSNKCK